MRRRHLPRLLLAGLLLLLGGCAHTYALELQGQAPPGGQVGLSYWAQPEGAVIPAQRPGTPVATDAQGGFTVVSRTEIRPHGFTIPGPPPYLTLDVHVAGPLCVIVPTTGIWETVRSRFVALPPLRALTPGETAYELPVPGLPAPLRVLRRAPEQESCVPPGG
ncbi:MAG: hypothetical protein RBU45_10110 [Myxococcota bacterium]|jgi:hypothetical protein|nr:hypothetical protein [Myxococcota bacterium]